MSIHGGMSEADWEQLRFADEEQLYGRLTAAHRDGWSSADVTEAYATKLNGGPAPAGPSPQGEPGRAGGFVVAGRARRVARIKDQRNRAKRRRKWVLSQRKVRRALPK